MVPASDTFWPRLSLLDNRTTKWAADRGAARDGAHDAATRNSQIAVLIGVTSGRRVRRSPS